MKSRIAITACLTLLLTSGCAWLLTPNVETKIESLKPGQYKLDPEHTTVLFKVKHLGLSTYVGRFNEFDASLDFDPNNMSKTRLDAQVKINSIDVNNKDLEETLRDDDWFDSQRFPVASFKTLSVSPGENGNFIFNAELTLKGVTKPISLNATFNGGASNVLTGYYTLGFSAQGSLKRSEFGIDTAIPMVSDKVDIEIFAEFQKK
ncbi:MAG: YceI family protein [Gammaproteobacteria bacterium]|nr:YceI family protein [Gammaproteobacteria bacterium]